MVEAILGLVQTGLNQIHMVIGAVADTRSRNENALYTTVYVNGADYATAKTLHRELYNKNPKQFDTIYNEMSALRFSGKDFDLKKQQQKYKTIGIVFIVLLILIFIYFIYKNLK